MKTIAIGSIFTVLALMMVLPSAFADHAKVDVSIPEGSQFLGCEETNECYIPSEAVVDVGGEVTWTNDDSAAHTVTSGTVDDSESVGAVFDSGLIMAGKTFTHKFEAAGEFPYFCIVHPWMTGVVIAQEAMEDDHMAGDGMKDKEANAMAMTSDGSLTVNIYADAPAAGKEQTIKVDFTNAQGKSSEHVNYDITITQDGEELISETAHVHPGDKGSHTISAVSDSPLDIQVTILGIGLPDDEANWTGPIGDTISLSVVPEFGPIAMMVLAVAIVSIVAFTTRSKVIPRL